MDAKTTNGRIIFLFLRRTELWLKQKSEHLI